MMSGYTYLARESTILLYSGALGIEMSLLYDFFRMIRRVFSCNRAVLACMDMLFWGFTAFRTFYVMHTYSNGTLRWFAILGTAVVITIYMRFVSKYVVAFGVSILSVVRNILAKANKCLTNILKMTIIKSTRKRAKKGKADGKTGSIPDQVS